MKLMETHSVQYGDSTILFTLEYRERKTLNTARLRKKRG
jgi:hypothetical protein